MIIIDFRLQIPRLSGTDLTSYICWLFYECHLVAPTNAIRTNWGDIYEAFHLTSMDETIV
jgi:hypothetical protein